MIIIEQLEVRPSSVEMIVSGIGGNEAQYTGSDATRNVSAAFCPRTCAPMALP
jgi:hypothetical protein